MARTVDTTPGLDPYRNFRFRLKWQGRHVAGFSKMSALKGSTAPVAYREGGDPSISRRSPGRAEYDAITLERGVTHDVEFERWANNVWDFGAGPGAGTSLDGFRRDLVIELYDEAGQRAKAWTVYRGWISAYSAVPELDANANAVTIETIKLENDGWERTDELAEPAWPNP
jgi:phage tail-like protein